MAVKTLNRENWKQVERAVALVETVIDPDARVEHDVRLWERKAKEWVQCDVVIRHGVPPRESLTIVEVQARKTKVDRMTFNAWCVKRDNVLAQHLICVSEAGYERPVIESAREQGNAVRLVTFREVEIGELPLKFPNKHLGLTIPVINPVDLSVTMDGSKYPSNPFKRGDVEFSLNGVPINVGTLFGRHSQPVSPPTNGEAIHTERLDFTDDEIVMMTWPGNAARVRSLSRKFTVKSEEVILSIGGRAYFQIAYDGVLAWYASGVGQVNGELATMHLVMTKQDDGSIDVKTILSDAFEEMPIHSMGFNFAPAAN